MTFSSKTKNELSRLEIEDKCCAISELAGLIRMSGSIQISGTNKISLIFTTENAAIARRIFSILRGIYKDGIQVSVKRNKHLNKNNSYLVKVMDRKIANKVLEDVGYTEGDQHSIFNPNYSIPKEIVENRCCKRSYIRGAFMGGGSISNPEKAYHLEFVTGNEEHGNNLSALINEFGLNSKVIERKENYVVYLKEADQIVDILNIMGAHQALLKLEDIRVLKDIRNNINRLVNCETANLSKTINAAVKQVENIQYIDDTIGLHRLPTKLREVAELRLNNQDLSLREIGEMLDPVVGKSGINHRFRNIEKIAEDLREGKEIG